MEYYVRRHVFDLEDDGASQRSATPPSLIATLKQAKENRTRVELTGPQNPANPVEGFQYRAAGYVEEIDGNYLRIAYRTTDDGKTYRPDVFWMVRETVKPHNVLWQRSEATDIPERPGYMDYFASLGRTAPVHATNLIPVAGCVWVNPYHAWSHLVAHFLGTILENPEIVWRTTYDLTRLAAILRNEDQDLMPDMATAVARLLALAFGWQKEDQADFHAATNAALRAQDEARQIANTINESGLKLSTQTLNVIAFGILNDHSLRPHASGGVLVSGLDEENQRGVGLAFQSGEMVCALAVDASTEDPEWVIKTARREAARVAEKQY